MNQQKNHISLQSEWNVIKRDKETMYAPQNNGKKTLSTELWPLSSNSHTNGSKEMVLFSESNHAAPPMQYNLQKKKKDSHELYEPMSHSKRFRNKHITALNWSISLSALYISFTDLQIINILKQSNFFKIKWVSLLTDCH